MSGRSRLTIVVIVIVIAFASPFSLAAPTVKVLSPVDGTILTVHETNVTGSTTVSDGKWVQGDSAAFNGGSKDGVFVNASGRVILTGEMWDDFDGNSLDTDNWTVTSRVNLDASVQNGDLHLKGKSASGTSWGARVWIASNSACSDMIQATVTVTGSGSYSSALFLWKDSNNYIGIGPQCEPSVYGNGLHIISTAMVGGVNHYNSHGDLSPTLHTLKITLDGTNARLYVDNSLIDTIATTLMSAPVQIRAHARDNGDTIDAAYGDFVSQFQSPGTLTSSVYDSRCSPLALKQVDWTSTEPTGTALTIKMRSSNSSDMASATPWTAVTDGQTSGFPTTYRYVQYLANLTTTTIYDTPALNDITFVYPRPVARVEVSIDGVNWTNATGTTSWFAGLVLPENRTYIWVRATDATGDRSTASVWVDVDTTPPAGGVVIDGGRGIAPAQDVTLSFDATDRYGVSQVMVDDSADFPDGYWRPYVGSMPWHLPWGDGSKTVYAKFKDANGWESAIASDSIVLDTFPPVGSISIDGGAEFTNTTSVALSIDATDLTGVSDMRVGEASDLAGAVWRPFGRSLGFELSKGDGEKSVYVSFRDPLGHVSVPIRATIVLDTTPPMLDLAIDGGAAYTNRTGVQVGVVPIERFRMTFIQMGEGPDLAQAEKQPFVTTMGWTLGPGDGTKAIYARAWDAAGNVGPVSVDSIVLDTVAPVATVIINGGAGYTNARVVSVALTIIDDFIVTHMQLSEDPDLTGAAVLPVGTPLELTLSSGDGTKTIHVRAMDAAGNVGATASASIVLDTTPPVLALSVVNGSMYAASREVELGLRATDSSPIVRMQLGEDPGLEGSMVEAFAATSTFLLSAVDGQKTVLARVWDAAGNDGPVASVQVVLDTTPPLLRLTVEGGSPVTASRTVRVQLDVTDSWGVMDAQLGTDPTLQGSTFAPYAHVMDLTLTGADGVKVVYGRVRDLAGNLGPVASEPIILDTAPPRSEILSATGSPGRLLVHVSWAGADAASGVTGYDVQRKTADGAWTDWLVGTDRTEGDFEGEDGQTYSFRVRAADLAGNLGEYPGTVQNAVRVWIPQTPLPEVAITDPLGNASVSGVMHVSGTALSRDASRGIAWVKVSYAGGPWMDANGTVVWSIAVDTTLMGDGPQTIKVRAFDGQRYSEEVSRDIVVRNPSTEEPGAFIGSAGFYIIILLVIAVVGVSVTYIVWKGRGRA